MDHGDAYYEGRSPSCPKTVSHRPEGRRVAVEQRAGVLPSGESRRNSSVDSGGAEKRHRIVAYGTRVRYVLDRRHYDLEASGAFHCFGSREDIQLCSHDSPRRGGVLDGVVHGNRRSV